MMGVYIAIWMIILVVQCLVCVWGIVLIGTENRQANLLVNRKKNLQKRQLWILLSSLGMGCLWGLQFGAYQVLDTEQTTLVLSGDLLKNGSEFCLAGYTKGNNIFRGRDRKRIRENGSEEGVVLKCMFGYEVRFVAVGLVSVFIPDKWVLLWCVGVSVVFLMLSVFFYKGFAKRIETKDF